ENAVAVDMALGGSTNTALHLPAIARAAGVSLTLEDMDRISRKTPHLCSMSPAGKHHMQDLYRAGGVQAVMLRLAEGGLINGDCLTVTTKTVKENLCSAKV
ncbi:MAG TPA: dihydroxy-acid dehydratase, partial [Thermovirga lienii]|nr:dihydroxy-acid dehydratase [Thermovirga lienii]